MLVFSDVHFNPLYDGTLCASLDAADASKWQAILEGSLVTTLPAYGADTNYLLFKRALSSISQNLEGCQVIVCSGDLLGINSPNSMPAAEASTPPTHLSTRQPYL